MALRILLVRIIIEGYENKSFAEPIGLHYLVEGLSKEGFDIKIHDMMVKPQLNILLRLISQFKPDVIGLSSLILGFNNVSFLTDKIRKRFPKIKIVLGGPCTFISPRNIMANDPNIDYIIKGEGEDSFAQLCRILDQRNKKSDYGLKNIQGLTYRLGSDIKENERHTYRDMDELPYPINRFKDYSKYRQPSIISAVLGSSRIIWLETARGCKFNCNFCGNHYESYRVKSPENVIKDIESLVLAHNITKFFFTDHTFTADQERVKKICELILKKNLKIEWTCTTRVDCVTLPLLKLMRKAGCRIINYGIESMLQETLDVYNKGYDVKTIKNAIMATRKAKILSLAYVIICGPGETRAMVIKNSRLLNKLRVDFVLYGILRPYYGTKMFDFAVKKGITDSDKNLQQIFSGKEDLMPVYDDILSHEEINQLEVFVYKSFYFRWGYVWFRLRQIRSFREFRIMFRLFRDLLAY